MARGLTPEEIVAKQIRNSANAVEDYRRGVRNVKSSPTAKAAQNLGKYKENTAKAVDDGTMAASLNAVTLTDWQERTATVGADNIAKGVRNSEPKLLQFQRQIKPHRDAVAAEVQAMPKNSLEDGIARMEKNARGMSRFKFQKGRKG